LPSRTARRRPRHAASRGYRRSQSHRHRRRSGITLGVVVATAAGAAAIGGISVGISLHAAPAGSVTQSAAARAAIATGSAAGTSRQNRPAAESESPLETKRPGARSPGHGTSRHAGPATPRKPSANATAATRHEAGTRHEAAARPSASPSASQSASPSKPYEFYDSVEPETVPAGAIVATYSTGARPVPASAVAGRKQVLWIDTLATDPAGSGALDVEPGCATPSQVPGWVSSRLEAHPNSVAIVYMSLSEWPQVQAEVASLPASMRSRIRWWVADPTGVPHIVPGSSATQWYWGSTYDESMAEPNFDPPLVAGPSA
jgi:hypothetical protein